MSANEIEDWAPQAFRVASSQGVVLRTGWVYRGLGLYLNGAAEGPEVRYELIHLNTGHAICGMGTGEAKAKAIGKLVAEAAAWSDFGLDFSNHEPQLQAKVDSIMRASFGFEIETHAANKDYEAARAISAAQEANDNA